MDVLQNNNDLSSIGKTDAAALIPVDGLALDRINALTLGSSPISRTDNLSTFKPNDSNDLDD
jgi:hypothetical protein